MRRILVLEDEADIRGFIVINLKRAGFEVVEASTGEEALEIFAGTSIDVAVLDVMLPGIDGFEVCKKIREQDPSMGIIMLTAKGQETDKVSGLSLGADDYMVKPFSPAELLARIDALLRRVDLINRSPGERSGMLSAGPFELDARSRRILKAGVEIELTQTEYSIMKLFMENQERAFTRDAILDEVWGQDYFGNWKTVDVNIRRLRQKVEDDASHPKYIETVWGYGYRWGAKG